MVSDSDKAKPAFDKGDRAAIVTGQHAGTRGEVFWVGENKYGPGMRYGMRADDGETHWVDDAQIGSEDTAPPAPPKPERKAGPPLAKGSRAKIISGQGAGKEGEVFWAGESKFGPGMRYGIKDADDETYWVDEQFVQAVAAAPSDLGVAADAGDAPTGGDTSRGDDDLPPEAFEQTEGFEEEDIPF